MIRLDGHSLTAAGWFRPETMQLNVGERDSTASFTCPIDTASFTVGAWLLDDDEPGAGTVWRIRSVDKQYDRNTQTVNLEHIVSTLKDRIMFGSITPATMSGTPGASTCTAAEAAAYILSQQEDWQIGDIEYSVSNPYSFNSETLFDALETVSSSLEDCIWEYDLSAYPFTLHIRQLGNSVGTEMRMSRNIQTMKVTADRNGMYTRFYPIGKNNLKLSGNGYVSKNEGTWGVISRVETDNGKTTTAELSAWASERLARHAEPLITVSIAGLDLCEATGETLDGFVIGRKCRVPLPAYGTTVTERITKLTYRDKMREPENVTVTLANKLADVATILKEQSAKGGRSSRNNEKDKEEDHAWIVDTKDKVALVAEAVAGKDGNGDPNWSRVAELTVSGSGIDARVTRAEGDIVTNYATLLMNEQSIRMEVADGLNELSGALELTASQLRGEFTDGINGVEAELVLTASGLRGEFTDGLNGLESELELTASQLRAEFEDETNSLRGEIEITASGLRSEFEDETTSIRSEISQQADKIAIVVDGNNNIKAAQIVAAVNASGSSVLISADKILLSGNTTVAGMLTIDNGKLKVNDGAVFLGDITITGNGSTLYTQYVSIPSGGGIAFGGQTPSTSYVLTASDMETMIISAEVNGNVLTLTPKTGQPITFSKATSLSGVWSGSSYTATATITATQNNETAATLTETVDHQLSGTTQYQSFSAEIGKYNASYTSFTRIQAIQGHLETVTENGHDYVDVVWTDHGNVERHVARIAVSGTGTNVTLSSGWANGTYNTQALDGQTILATTSYNPLMKLNGQASYSNFTAEIYESTQSGDVTRKSIAGYLVLDSNGTSSKVYVNTASGGTGTNVAAIAVGSVYTAGRTDEAGTLSVTQPANNSGSLGGNATRTTINIKATATTTNGSATNNRDFTLARSTYTNSGGDTNQRCVILKQGSTAIGRIDIMTDYNAGVTAGATAEAGSLTVSKPANNSGSLGGNETRTTINIIANATTTNGSASANQDFTLARASYTNGDGETGQRCVILKRGSTAIGRIDVMADYNSGKTAGATEEAASLTVGKPANNSGSLGSNEVRTTINIKATATTTNGSATNNQDFTLARASYTNSGGTANQRCVILKRGSTSIGRIDVMADYNAGETAGKAAVTITGPTWSTADGTTVTHNSATYSTSGKASEDSITTNMYLTAGSWSNGSVTVYLRQTSTSGTIRAQRSISAPTPTVTFDCTDLDNPTTDQNDKPITATVKHGTTTLKTASQTIHMTQGSWSSGKKAVNVRMTDDNGKLVTRLWITIPTISESCTNPAANTFRITASCGGSSVTYQLKTTSTGGLSSFSKV